MTTSHFYALDFLMLFHLNLFKNIFAHPLLVEIFFHHFLIDYKYTLVPPNIARFIKGVGHLKS